MTNQVEVTEVVLTKADKALLIFVEEAAKGDEKLRARCMKRFEDELSMQKAGASTYFQNCKKKAAGEKVKHYYKSKTEQKVVDDSSDDVPESFEVVLKDGTIQCFLNQQEKEDFIKANESIVSENQEIEQEVA